MLFFGLKAHGHGAVNYFDWTWACVGQVDLFLTNIGPEMLQLGIKIEVKVIGDGFLEERAVMAWFSVLLKGDFDLRYSLSRSDLPINFKENCVAPL